MTCDKNMRILILTNFYPPYYVGGYELACKDVVDRLEKRGHEVFVLTSRYGLPAPCIQNRVFRWLHSSWFTDPILSTWQFGWTQFQNTRSVVRLIKQLTPDTIYVWNLDRLGPPLVHMLGNSFTRMAQNGGPSTIPVVFAISDWWLLGKDQGFHHWLEYWRHIPGNPVKRPIKRVLQRLLAHVLPTTPVTPRIKYAHFFSRSLQRQHADQGIVPEHVQIIYHGVPIEQYQYAPEAMSSSSSGKRNAITLLYCGQIIEHKGVHTAIEAVALLVHEKKMSNLHLTIIGPQPFPEYMSRLNALIDTHALQHIVTIHEKVSRQALDKIYSCHDVLIFPSIWEEPFSITILEAMAHGLVVVATPTGGSAEILQDGKNSLVFPPENAYVLAEHIEGLIQSPELIRHLRTQAVDTIRSQYTLEKMVSKIEHYLLHVIEVHPS